MKRQIIGIKIYILAKYCTNSYFNKKFEKIIDKIEIIKANINVVIGIKKNIA